MVTYHHQTLKFEVTSVLLKSAILCILLLASTSCLASSLSITSKSVVVLGKDATEPEKYAAREFTKYIKLISGIELPVSETSSKGKVNIYVGQTSITKSLLKGFDWKTLKSDGIIIKTLPGALILAGDRPRGTLYAVYTFLEDYLGCRWWTYDAEYVPSIKDIKIGSINRKYTPKFAIRESYFRSNMTDTTYPIKMKLNGHFNKIPPEMGGHLGFIGFVHTFDNLIPYSVYGKDHPEWFTYSEGKRLSGVNQLCLSNKEMIAELIKNTLKACKENPDTGIVSVSQNDNYKYCQCEECNALAEKYGGQSGLMLYAVNQVADAVKKEYPSFYVETLAYLYTRGIPKDIVPRDNMIIRLCSIECNYAENLKGESNKDFYRDLTQWKKISKRMFIWDYACNFLNYHIAHPNYHVLGDNINVFAENNVMGIFEQGDSANYNSGFDRLKGWLIAKLLWDPSQDTDKLIKEFLDGYYGKPAAPHIYDFLKYTEKLVVDKKVKLGCFMHDNSWMTSDEMITCFKYLNAALDSVTGDPVYEPRVLAERLAFQVAWLISPEDYRTRIADSGVLKYKTRKDFINVYGAYCKANNNYNFSESQPIMYSILGIDLNPDMTKTAKKPAECANLADTEWYDIQDKDLETPMGERWVYQANDPDASDGKCLVMPCNHVDWAIQKKLFQLVLLGVAKADIYVSAKVTKPAKSGKVFEVGLYDDATKIIAPTIGIDASTMPDGKYVTIKLGTFDISEKLIFWAAPGGDPSTAESISIDRIFIVPVKG